MDSSISVSFKLFYLIFKNSGVESLEIDLLQLDVASQDFLMTTQATESTDTHRIWDKSQTQDSAIASGVKPLQELSSVPFS